MGTMQEQKNGQSDRLSKKDQLNNEEGEAQPVQDSPSGQKTRPKQPEPSTSALDGAKRGAQAQRGAPQRQKIKVSIRVDHPWPSRDPVSVNINFGRDMYAIMGDPQNASTSDQAMGAVNDNPKSTECRRKS